MDERRHILIGWPNRAAGASYSGGAWQPALPLGNLALREPWRVARSANALPASTQWRADLGAVRNLRCIALGGHNLSLLARWRVQIGTAAGAADLYDSAWQAVWTMSFDTDMLDWEDASVWEGVVDDASAYAGYPYLAIHVLPEWINARHVSVQIDDAANAQGFVQIGQCWIGGGLQPRLNASYGLQDSWVDATQIADSDSGYTFADARRRRRRVQFATEHLSLNEGAIVHELQRRQGVWGQVLWLPYPKDQQQCQRYGFIGRLAELSAIDYPYCKTRSAAWSITEI